MGNVLKCRRMVRVIAEINIIELESVDSCFTNLQMSTLPINLKVKLESYNSKSSSGGDPTVTVCCRLSGYCSTAASASDVLKRRSES